MTGLAVASLTLAVTMGASTAISGCSKDSPTPGASSGAASAAPSASAAAPSMPSASAAAAAPSSAPSAAPSASAAAAPVPRDCPKGSAGDGTSDKPCTAKGTARLMEVTWTGKNDEKGPQFRVVNKSTLPILYGKIAVFFYDKTGRRLELQDTNSTPPKPVPYRTCSGNIFGGVMKPGEKAVITFSCVRADHVPEGTTAMEAEMQTVGFADATEKKNDFYWTNPDLVWDTRKKGGGK